MRFSIAVERRQQYLGLPCELLFADRPVASRREKFVIAGNARKRLAAGRVLFLFHNCGDAVSFFSVRPLVVVGREKGTLLFSTSRVVQGPAFQYFAFPLSLVFINITPQRR